MNTSKQRSHTGHPTGRPPTVLADATHPAALGRIAAAVRTHLAARRADHAPLAELVVALRTNITTIKATVAHYPDLGIAGTRERRLVFSVHPAVRTAGFEPVYTGGRIILRLGVTGGPPWPLTISGAHLGSGSQHDLAPQELSGYGHGELGYTVTRLTLMARRWLILPKPSTNHELTLRLFELVARAWQASPGPAWSSGRLHAHQAELNLPIGTQFWHDNTPTSRLELVVWADKQLGFQLVNVYPAGTYRSIFGAEET